MGYEECMTTPGTNRPNDLSARDATKMIEAVRSEIRQGIPDDVRVRLQTGYLTQHPSAILAEVRKVTVDSSDAAHRSLEALDKRQQFTQTENIADFFMEHRKLRGLMY